MVGGEQPTHAGAVDSARERDLPAFVPVRAGGRLPDRPLGRGRIDEERALARVAVHPALYRQLLVGRNDGLPVDAELAGQLPRRW